jgi:predicted phosphodiesterase
LPLKKTLTYDGTSLGIIHGAGGSKLNIRERIVREFVRPRIIVYGHTHQAFWGEENGIWFMNPGSPTDTVVAEYRSVGLLIVEPEMIRGEIIRL